MKIIILTFLTLLCCFNAYSQISLEQSAFDFFVDSIYFKNVRKNKVKYYLNEVISDKKSGFDYTVCFQDYYQEFNKLDQSQKDSVSKQRESYIAGDPKIKVRDKESKIVINAGSAKRSSKTKNIISVRKADIYIPNKFFVEIAVFTEFGQDRFTIELIDRKVTRWCKGFVAY